MAQCSCDVNLGYKSAWYKQNSEELESLLMPGDLIELRRGVYHHWAVYAGDWFSPDKPEPQVFHAGSANVSPAGVLFGSLSFDKRHNGVGVVAVDPLSDVWMESEARINNEMDLKYPPFSASEILIRAEIRVKDQLEYNLIANNCEHFAVWCRNGVRESVQSEVSLKTGMTTVCTYACMALAGAMFMMLKLRREFTDEYIFSDGGEDEDEDDKEKEDDKNEVKHEERDEEKGKKDENMIKRMSISLD